MVAHYQEVSLAAMEGRFQSGPMAGIALIGQPNVRERRLDNLIELPGVLSLLAYGTFHSDIFTADEKQSAAILKPRRSYGSRQRAELSGLCVVRRVLDVSLGPRDRTARRTGLRDND